MHNFNLHLLVALGLIFSSSTTINASFPTSNATTTTTLDCPNCKPTPIPYPLSLIFTLTKAAAVTSPSSNATKITTLHCPNCGSTPIPYPFSTSPTCGDPLYKLRCTQNGKLYFDALNKSSYPIITINPQTQRFLLKHTPYTPSSSCINSDFTSGGIWLNSSLPFTISENNLILKLNCSPIALKSPMNCSSNSLCHIYLRDNHEAHKRCGAMPLCCAYTSGGSQTSYRINLSDIKCRVYRSFVNLSVESNLPVSKWPDPAIEIQWLAPREPFCDDGSNECKKLLAYSSCGRNGKESRGEVRKRCVCVSGYQWDFVRGICAKVICETKRCRKQRLMKRVKKGITYTVSIILLLSLSIFIFYKHKQRIKHRTRQILIKEREKILNTNNVSGKSSKLFTDKEINKATNNFAKSNLLGSGGFGDVYLGKLPDNKTSIAVKRAKLGNTKGIEQVLNEVRVLCQVNHKSLVRLLGCCVELNDPVLVYEFIQNGTLYEHLHNTKSETLTWKRRLIIAHQTAQGLSYLHFSAVPSIIHRDIKSGNILLDENFNAKISDFGISRLAESDETHISTCVQGTLGYLDPEYHRNFQLSDKSDVYSFGVVLLEMVTGQKAVDVNRAVEDVSLVSYVRRKVKCERRIRDVIEPDMRMKAASELEFESMVTVVNLALACLDEKRQKRPSIKEVEEEIEYVLSIITEDESKRVGGCGG